MAETPAQQVAKLLKDLDLRLVLAESCTGGMAASLLTQVPGISEWFCGSAVTYREQTKQHWLKIPKTVFDEFSTESQATSDAMALGVLTETQEADIGCSITGHLGPGVELKKDGWVFVSIAANQTNGPVIISRESFRLSLQTRTERQSEAANWMLSLLAQSLSKFR